MLCYCSLLVHARFTVCLDYALFPISKLVYNRKTIVAHVSTHFLSLHFRTFYFFNINFPLLFSIYSKVYAKLVIEIARIYFLKENPSNRDFHKIKNKIHPNLHQKWKIQFFCCEKKKRIFRQRFSTVNSLMIYVRGQFLEFSDKLRSSVGLE